MRSLAPIRYAGVLKGRNGPVERVEYGRTEICGRTLYQAHAHLSGHLNLTRERRQIFGQADGTGTDASAMIARYKSISEALERWAYHYTMQAGLGNGIGAQIDPTTAGMAAFPGLFKRSAQMEARREAAERYCLASWWNGALGGRPIDPGPEGTHGLEIDNPVTRHRVVVVWRKSAGGFYSYGFSAAMDLERACWGAAVEMERARQALNRFFRANPEIQEADQSALENFMERRIFYYSLPRGHQEFRQQVEASARLGPANPVEPVFDREIKGPWGRYATVWRVIYPVATRDHLNPDRNCFYW